MDLLSTSSLFQQFLNERPLLRNVTRGGGKLLDSRHSAGLGQAVRSRNQTVAVIALNQEDGRFFGGVFARQSLVVVPDARCWRDLCR